MVVLLFCLNKYIFKGNFVTFHKLKKKNRIMFPRDHYKIIYENKITIYFDVQGKKQKLEIMS